MVARITSGSNLSGVLKYNADKVNRGEADLLLCNRVIDMERPDRFNLTDAMQSFTPYLAANRRTKNPVFHVSLNPDPSDKLADEQLVEIAQEYMERMGFGDQPYYVFKHRDIDREHIHIVSVRIDEYGRKLDHNFERRRSVEALQSIEQRYGLRPAVKGEEQREFDTARRVEYGRGNLKQQMKSTVRLLAEQYRFGSITEYRTLLNLYHVDLEERKGEANGKRWNGIVYTATDERGEWVGTPIKSSNLTPKGGYKFLQKMIAKNDADLKSETTKAPIRATVARAMHRARTQDEFVRLLKAAGIDTVFRQNKAGRITGVTFIDHRLKTVLNGSRLGKSYSANVFQELFNNPDADRAALLPKLTVPAPAAPRKQTAGQPEPQRPGTVVPQRVEPPAEQPPKPAPTPPRQTEKIRVVPPGLFPQPRAVQPASHGIGESLFNAAGDLLGQLTDDGPMSQEEFETLRRNLSRKRKRRKTQGITR